MLTALSTHHVPVHAHPNNVGAFEILGGVPVPDILEMLFVRRDSFEFAAELPPDGEELRRPNDPNRPGYALGLFDRP
jgi:hypothetical protein